MDDEFSFGNVWGDSSSPKPLPAALLTGPPKATTAAPAAATAFDDFDDFADFNDTPQHLPTASTSAAQGAASANGFAAAGDDDDFGDFGDFGDAPAPAAKAQPAAFGYEEDDDGFGTFGSTPSFQPLALSIRTQQQQKDWAPLQLDPLPSLDGLTEQTDEILEPLWEKLRPDVFTDEPERQVEGMGQVLVTSESRSLYHTLLESALTPTKPPNWTRSRIRRQHLITLGIPINLDEVLAPVIASGRATPTPGTSSARPSSAPPTPRPGHPSVLANVAAVPGPRSATPKPSGLRNHVAASASGRSTPTIGGGGVGNGIGSTVSDLGPAPQLDLSKIDEMLALDADTLPLLPLPLLNAHLDTLRSLTATTSSALTHLLQQREALQQDSEAYNAVIADMIQKETQKMRMGGGGSRTSGKRGSVL